MKKILALGLVALFGMNMNAQDKTENKPFKPTVKVNGRIQYDFEFVTDYDKNTTDKDWLNGNEFRRVHFSAAGKVAKNVKYKVETSFAHGSIGFRDLYIKYNAGKLGSFAVGSMAEATGLNMMTSSKYITFFERSTLTAFQDFRWGSGIHYSNFGLFGGKVGLQMSITNPNGSAGGGFKDASLEDGMSFVARATTTLMNDKEAHKVVHLGVNYDSRAGKQIKFRPENHMGSKYDTNFASDNRTDLGFEFGSTFGPLSLQAEYKMNNSTVDADNKTYKINSYYAFASYFITGEHRPYKHGAFGRVKPKNDIDNGGMGALEVALRYSSVDNSDYLSSFSVNNYDKVNNLTFGLNWYLNAHSRIMYNYVTSDYNGLNGEKTAAHLFRVQMDF